MTLRHRLRLALRRHRDVTPITNNLAVSGNAGAQSLTARLCYPTHVSVAADLEHPTTTHSFELSPDQVDLDELADAVRTVRDAMPGVLVHCHEGRERAPTVAALAIARDGDLETAWQRVRWVRPRTDPTPELERAAERVLRSWRLPDRHSPREVPS